MIDERRKINILFVLPNFDTGGSEKLVFDIIRHIDKSRFAPVLCVFFSGKYEQQFLKLNVPFYVIHKDGIRSKRQTAQFLSDIVRRHKIQIVNTHHNSPLIQGLIPFKILNRVRWFHTEHTRVELDPNINVKVKFLCRIAMMFVDKAVGIAQGVCDDYRESLGVPQRKIVKVLNGVDVERFQRKEYREERIEKRKTLGIDREDVVIGMFANFRKQKNHANLIRAFALLAKKMEEGVKRIERPVRLVLAGDGPEFENSKQLCRELGLFFVDCSSGGVNTSIISAPFSIFFLGPRHDIPELMNMIDIYCLPSHFEGLPFSLIEAFAAGKRVVATDVIGNRDVIQEMGYGTLVEPDNVEKLANALVKSVEQRGWSRDNLSSIVDFPFSFSKMMKKYERLFAEI